MDTDTLTKQFYYHLLGWSAPHRRPFWKKINENAPNVSSSKHTVKSSSLMTCSLNWNLATIPLPLNLHCNQMDELLINESPTQLLCSNKCQTVLVSGCKHVYSCCEDLAWVYKSIRGNAVFGVLRTKNWNGECFLWEIIILEILKLRFKQ